MTLMNFATRIFLDMSLLALIVLRIHRESIFEPGNFLRIGLFLAVGWLAFVDLDNGTDWINVTGVPGSIIQGGTFRAILILSTLIDIERAWRKKHDPGPIVRAIDTIMKEEAKEEAKAKAAEETAKSEGSK